jgi:uncharacterized membrane-anchored protein YhcB (DUF1043 family)
MSNLKYVFKFLAVFAISAFMAAAFADESAIASDIEKLKVMKEKEKNQIDQQENNFAEQYRKTAELVKKQGGDPRPLLEAAALYEKRAQ